MAKKDEWKKRNPEKVKAYGKMWRAKNRGRAVAYQKQWKKKNPEKEKAHRKTYYLKNKERFKEWHTRYAKEHIDDRYYHALNNKMKKRGTPIDFSKESFLLWLSDNKECHYCGTTLIRGEGSRKKPNSFTIDRKDSTIGYEFDNMVSCCRRCNVIKGNWFTEKQMLEIADKYLRGMK